MLIISKSDNSLILWEVVVKALYNLLRSTERAAAVCNKWTADR